jgi:transcriptional regulator with XRE-family HTH domain
MLASKITTTKVCTKDTEYKIMEVVSGDKIMNDAQSVRLGRLLVQGRQRKGLSLRALAELTDIPYIWLSRVERGFYNQPAPERLTKLAEILDIDPERLDRASKGHLSSSLPSVRTYFRAKYDLPPEDIDRIERTIKNLQHKPRKERKENDNPNPTN